MNIFVEKCLLHRKKFFKSISIGAFFRAVAPDIEIHSWAVFILNLKKRGFGVMALVHPHPGHEQDIIPMSVPVRYIAMN